MACSELWANVTIREGVSLALILFQLDIARAHRICLTLDLGASPIPHSLTETVDDLLTQRDRIRSLTIRAAFKHVLAILLSLNNDPAALEFFSVDIVPSTSRSPSMANPSLSQMRFGPNLRWLELRGDMRQIDPFVQLSRSPRLTHLVLDRSTVTMLKSDEVSSGLKALAHCPHLRVLHWMLPLASLVPIPHSTEEAAQGGRLALLQLHNLVFSGPSTFVTAFLHGIRIPTNMIHARVTSYDTGGIDIESETLPFPLSQAWTDCRASNAPPTPHQELLLRIVNKKFKLANREWRGEHSIIGWKDVNAPSCHLPTSHSPFETRRCHKTGTRLTSIVLSPFTKPPFDLSAFLSASHSLNTLKALTLTSIGPVNHLIGNEPFWICVASLPSLETLALSSQLIPYLVDFADNQLPGEPRAPEWLPNQKRRTKTKPIPDRSLPTPSGSSTRPQGILKRSKSKAKISSPTSTFNSKPLKRPRKDYASSSSSAHHIPFPALDLIHIHIPSQNQPGAVQSILGDLQYVLRKRKSAFERYCGGGSNRTPVLRGVVLWHSRGVVWTTGEEPTISEDLAEEVYWRA